MNRKDSLKLMKVRELRADLRYKEYLKGKQELAKMENLIKVMHSKKQEQVVQGAAVQKELSRIMLKRAVTGHEFEMFEHDRAARQMKIEEIDRDIVSANKFREEIAQRCEELRQAYLKANREVDQWRSLDLKLVEEERRMEEIREELNEEPRAAVLLVK